ncbi:PREDICTED: paired amphipathic helix protein Sin3-like 5 [Camelina sativa]|uniref:Paired amphipathic helix protein Sin3-like 5 n=1 Tax=Camelina sativa TaxID=90675 RepID=A0ABM0U5L4_CAMSA|nr:PREDICTED: paired amphipathic helix protein Sin3-like 5 [Camelina sativa]
MPTRSAAHKYLKTVKKEFQDNPGKYNTFLKVLKDFEAGRIGTNAFITRAKDLFNGKQELLLGINVCLPEGSAITIENDQNPPKTSLTFSDAMRFIRKVKTRFQDDDHSWNSFLNSLISFRKDHKSVIKVVHEMTVLFQDHDDLLEEFSLFLPPSFAKKT